MVEKRKLNIIMISGKIGRGKDLVANYINLNYNFGKCAFANELKSILTEFGWNGIKDNKGRKLLQDVGQAVRAYDNDFWIKAIIRKTIGPHYRFAGINNFVISDLRFKNEANKMLTYLLDSDMIINEPDIRIIKIRINGKNYSVRSDSNDISETDLDDYEHFDYIINNTSTKEYVYNQVDMIMNELDFEKEKQSSIREELWME